MNQTPAAAGPRPQLLHDGWALTVRAIRVTLRNPVLLMMATFFPLILLVLITVSFGSLVAPGGIRADYVNFSLPLFAVMGIMFAGLGTAMTTYDDLQSGFDRRLRALPIARSAPLIGRIAGDAVRNLITLLAVIGVGHLLGFRFTGGLLGALGFLILPLVFGTGVAWMMVAIAVHAKSGEAVGSALNAILLVASFLSTGFVPRQDLPTWIQPLAAANPVSSVVEAMRGLAATGPIAAPTWRTLAWTVALIAVFATIAIRGYRGRER
ncbi:ABC transporter permease [Nocardia sp. NPDC051832]|uniref:ABC transporter permease n=1 Tax=Nocardia sp. NPDC051832 TaxID=3155673 RepID=UPI0034406B4C